MQLVELVERLGIPARRPGRDRVVEIDLKYVQVAHRALAAHHPWHEPWHLERLVGG